MATDVSSELTEVELLYQYIGRRLTNGARKLPLAQLMSDYAEYRCQLEEWRNKVREGLDSLDRGEGRPLDLDALSARVDKRLDAEGIPE
jgi:hypothetical protein